MQKAKKLKIVNWSLLIAMALTLVTSVWLEVEKTEQTVTAKTEMLLQVAPLSLTDILIRDDALKFF